MCSCLRLRPSPTAAREYVSVRKLYYGSLRNKLFSTYLSLKLGDVMVQSVAGVPRLSFIINLQTKVCANSEVYTLEPHRFLLPSKC